MEVLQTAYPMAKSFQNSLRLWKKGTDNNLCTWNNLLTEMSFQGPFVDCEWPGNGNQHPGLVSWDTSFQNTVKLSKMTNVFWILFVLFEHGAVIIKKITEISHVHKCLDFLWHLHITVPSTVCFTSSWHRALKKHCSKGESILKDYMQLQMSFGASYS